MESNGLSPIGQEALRYAEGGFAVFPCNHLLDIPERADGTPGKKLNKIPLTANGFKDASRDAEQIIAWWTTWPNAMIGIPTGVVNGIDVIDPDRDAEKGIDGIAELAKLEEQHGALPDTVVVRTPRGGLHLWFRHRDGIINSRGQLPLSIDLKGTGGYIVVPPSAREDGKSYRYLNPFPMFQPAEMPDWLFDLITTKPKREAPVYVPPVYTNGAKKGEAWAESALRGEYDKVARQSPPGRNNQLNSSSFSLGQLVPGGFLNESVVVDSLMRAAEANGLVQEDGEKAALSTIFSGLGAGKQEPRYPPENRLPFVNGNGGNGSTPFFVDGMTEAVTPKPIKIISAFPIDPRTIPQRPWIVPGLLIRGHVTVLVAPPGAGKSLMTLQLSLMLSSAISWGGWTPRRQCRVLVINTEDDIDEMERRLATAATVMGVEQSAVGDRIALAEEPETIVIARTDSKTKTVMRTPLVEDLIQLIMDMRIDAIVVDPFAETFEGDENSNSELKWAAILWREIARRTKCAVFLVHHTRKYAAGMSGDMDAARGASALIGVARIVSTLFTMTSEEAKVFDINDSDRFRYVRFDDAKVQFGVVTGNARWFEKATYGVGNAGIEPGDDVGILKPWAPPGLLEGVDIGLINRCLNIIDQGVPDEDARPSGILYTKNKTSGKSTRWAGQVVIDTLGCDEDRAKAILKKWLEVKGEDTRGLLYEVDWNDGKQDRKGLKVDPTKRPGVTT